MTKTYQPLFANTFLMSALAAEYQSYCDEGKDAALLSRLQHWASKDFQNETKAEQAFTQAFLLKHGAMSPPAFKPRQKATHLTQNMQ